MHQPTAHPAAPSRRWRRWLIALTILAVAGFQGGPSLVARYHLYRGQRELQQFHTESAVRWLLAAEKAAPAWGETQFLLARAARREGRYDDADRYLQRAGQQGVEAARIRLERSLALAQTARVRDVQGELPRLIQSPGDDGEDICSAYVNGFCVSLNFGAADQLLEAWLQDFPRSAEAYFRRGNFCYGQTEWQGAIAAYRKCLEIDPARTRARLALAQCLMRMNDVAAAETEFRKVMQDLPQSREAELGWGDCLLSLARLAEARTVFEKLAARLPDDLDVRQRLGDLESQARRPAEALAWLTPVAQAWPEDPVIAQLMAQALQQTGRADEAQKYRDVARQADQALTQLEKLIDQVRDHPADLDLRCELGTMYVRYRSREEGLNWLKSVLQFDPRHAATHRALADYYARTGNAPLAAEHRSAAQEQSAP